MGTQGAALASVGLALEPRLKKAKLETGCTPLPTHLPFCDLEVEMV